MIRPDVPAPAEYLTVPLRRFGRRSIELDFAVSQWNMLWEAAQFRRRFFPNKILQQLPPELEEVADRGDVNIVFVPRTPSRFYEYAPLFHLRQGRHGGRDRRSPRRRDDA